MKFSLVKQLRRLFYKRLKQYSAGIVLYKMFGGTPKFLLIYRGGEYQDWTFPKGKIEKGETHIEAAKRECWEEVGIKPKVICELAPNYYNFYIDSESKYFDKTVYYFLGKTDCEKTNASHNPDSEESSNFVELKWFGINEASKKVSHKIEKGNLKEAYSKITS